MPKCNTIDIILHFSKLINRTIPNTFTRIAPVFIEINVIYCIDIQH